MKNLFLFILLIAGLPAFSCTNILVTKGASVDGSVHILYTCDGEFFYRLGMEPAMDHKQGEWVEFKSWRTGEVTGKIPQAPHTYAIIGNHMNEHQVAIGETTFTGREELINHSKFLHYWDLMRLALKRAKTAREAIEVMTGLVEEYGYASEGESFSIADKNEAWILEMIGTGNGGEGAIWVAVKIPDGMVSCHANKARIGEFPMDDPENCLYSDNVIDFAIEKGYYNPDKDGAFRFNDVYCPPTPSNLRYCETRVWSILRRTAPSLNLSTDYCRGVKGAERYPLWVKPDKKLGIHDIMLLARDHYEGTEFDMTKGIEAGPFGNPNRVRPLLWELDGKSCSWERPISTYNTSFSFISQSRSYLPDEVGGLIWFGMDDTYFTCYTPIYSCATEIPEPYTKGNMQEFSWESAWWAFNFVSNYTNLRYADMLIDVKAVQDSLENRYIKQQKKIEAKALQLLKTDREKGVQFLTEYSKKEAGAQIKEWKKLGEYLICKYNDGYIKDARGRAMPAGYSEEFRRKILNERKSIVLPVWDNKEAEEPGNF